jgi:hypothetical protein
MNISNNSIDATLSIWESNGAWFYPFIIVHGIGFILNLVSGFILRSKEFDLPMHTFLEFYSLNSAQIGVFSLFLFSANYSPLLKYLNFDLIRVYYLYINVPFIYMGHMYATMLDVSMTLDRISNYSRVVRACFKFCANKVVDVEFVFCVLAGFFFTFMQDYKKLELTAFHSLTNWYANFICLAKQRAITFSFAAFGVYQLFDAILVLAQVVLNVVSVFFIVGNLWRNKRRDAKQKQSPLEFNNG